ncbi:MAG: SPASM domain-containing protein, partial [Thermodesulfovibrio sp.]|nr:SPASM domain-containing protein [Thermodesulfovibrio sp.]
IIVSLLDFIPNEFLEKESLTPKTEEEFNSLKELALNVINEGKKLNLEISFNIAHPLKKGKICSENPIKAVFINSLGYVCPCVFTGIPADGFKNIYFGNISERTLPLILRSKKYKEFKKKFLSNDPSLPCSSCPKIRIVKI